MNETTNKREEIEEEHERLAAEAFQRIRSGSHWRDWRFIAAGFAVGREKAMRAAYTNQPMGRGYNTAFSEWMDSRPWARAIDKVTRSHLLWVHDNLAKIEEWRERLPASQKDSWNHPSTVKRAYERTMKVQEGREKGQPVLSPTEVLKQELAQALAERDRWKRQAEKSGSICDFATDKPDDIGRVVCEHVGPSRTERIGQAMIKAARAARQAHAG